MEIEREPTEDFPIETFRFLEGKLQILRRRIMKRAAEIAKIECPKTLEVYRVSEGHVTQALREILGTALWSY